jgi:metallo-beta-lactamase family protein
MHSKRHQEKKYTEHTATTRPSRGECTIGFFGGVGSVTGAHFVLDTGNERIAVDCGLEQGSDFAPEHNANDFPHDPSTLLALVVTHAHADHIGRIPKLVRDGFRGTIYSTPPTKDLAAIMLHDALSIMEYEAAHGGAEPLYGEQDITQALALWKTTPYHREVDIGTTALTLFDAGHILGSAHAVFTRNDKKIMFTGDIGNTPQPLVGVPEPQADVDYMVMESVYGNRVHEQVRERSSMLLREIQEVIAKKGTLIIPAFSLERTQGMLFEINNFVESGLIDPLPVFLDSPLAIAVTEVYRAHRAYLKPDVRTQIENGDDIFDFPKLKLTKTREQSNDIDHVPGPKIIIAGSGMSHGGRVLSHEITYLGQDNTTLVLVGFQTVGSVGRLLQDGVRKVTIDGVPVKVRAKISTIRGYSGHADRDMLITFAETSAHHVKRVFVTMGEERASLFLVQRLRDYLGIDATAPEANAIEPIDF